MKKTAVLFLALVTVFCFTACTKKSEDSTQGGQSTVSQTQQLTEKMTVTLPEVSTTAKPENDKQKAKEVKKEIKKYFSAADGEVTAESKGGFEYKKESLDESEMYSQEYSEEGEKRARENAADFAAQISSFYPDGEKIEYFDTQAEKIGGADNGIDSVIYSVIYINTQNQELIIKADSNGNIYYVSCAFTW